MRVGILAVALVAALVLPARPALADPGWLPHPAGATWTYRFSDSVYAQTPTTEKVTLAQRQGAAFTLDWTTQGLDNPQGAITSQGSVSFQETNSGLFNTNWRSSPPPTNWPVLCAQQQSCGNALSSTYFTVIWGSRSPVVVEPLLRGVAWASTGGAKNDVSSVSTYLGQQRITVPAFSEQVTAAVVRARITQAGALGDPYGSGTRTTWWVYGVGPVKVVFEHTGGSDAAVTTSVLQSTNLRPAPPPTDVDYFPLVKGSRLTYRWTNSKHLRTPEVERFTAQAVANDSARFGVASVSGPIRVKGSYGYAKRVDGVTNLWGNTAFVTRLKFPPLGPRGARSSQRDHFATPFDLMDFGLNPLLTAYPAAGQSWRTTTNSSEYSVYGVHGSATVLGVQPVTVPAGTFDALAIRSTLVQPGYPYGSGTRTSWFAPGRGLVKLVFDHADGSVSTIVLVK